MPAPTGIVDVLSTPPLSLLQQVLDTGGPYAAGDHTLTTFTTGGAFLLPAGTYDVGGTYGIMVVVNGAIPVHWGYTIGWDGGVGPVFDGFVYENRIAQVNLQRQLPISGAWATTEIFDTHAIAALFLWPVVIGSAARIGLHVQVGIAVDVFYMCVL